MNTQTLADWGFDTSFVAGPTFYRSIIPGEPALHSNTSCAPGPIEPVVLTEDEVLAGAVLCSPCWQYGLTQPARVHYSHSTRVEEVDIVLAAQRRGGAVSSRQAWLTVWNLKALELDLAHASTVRHEFLSAFRSSFEDREASRRTSCEEMLPGSYGSAPALLTLTYRGAFKMFNDLSPRSGSFVASHWLEDADTGELNLVGPRSLLQRLLHSRVAHNPNDYTLVGLLPEDTLDTVRTALKLHDPGSSVLGTVESALIAARSL